MKVIGSCKNRFARTIVATGPILAIIDVLLAPRRRIPSEIIKTGITVLTIASPRKRP
jgi:hypothetical protein